MALPTSGTLTLADIQTEFGGSNPIGLSEYYAGGSYVPAGTSGTNGAVPSSGTISVSNFYGTSAALDVQTVTVGLFSNKSGAYYGYNSSSGSISDGTFNPKGGALITRFDWNSGGTLYFVLSGSHTNAGWTQVRIVSSLGTDYTFTRASAGYSSNTSATQWAWASSGANPFPYQSSPTTTAVATFT